MFKLPSLPSQRAGVHELADYAELLSWLRGQISKEDILAYLNSINEYYDDSGCEGEDEINDNFLDEVMNEIEKRSSASGDSYPYKLLHEGTVLRHDTNDKSIVYSFFLLCTRLNMNKEKKHDSIDGTSLFEEVCAHIIKNYLGGGCARSLVFGTATHGSFAEKVDQLCKELGEGVGFRNLTTNPTHIKDDKLDIVAWIPFSDGLSSKLILFSQCKTGSNWKDYVSSLNPDGFIKKWVSGTISVTPIRSFCVSEACARSQWPENLIIDCGIFFDRCRLYDFFTTSDTNLMNKIVRWTDHAKDVAKSHLSIVN